MHDDDGTKLFHRQQQEPVFKIRDEGNKTCQKLCNFAIWLFIIQRITYENCVSLELVNE